MSSGLTPIKIRGKRGGAPEEKWKSAKKRSRPRARHVLASSPSPDAVSRASSLRPRKRKRRDVELSQLEILPTEIVQAIFEYSGNVHLALASSSLSQQLRSRHLYHQMTSHILQKVLGYADAKASDNDLRSATRLLNSRFMTWSFFCCWLRSHSESAQETRENDLVDYAVMWAEMSPSSGLLPPAKLLHGPWTTDKINFLRVFASGNIDLSVESLYHADLAHEGLVQAIAEHAVDAVHLLLEMGLKSSQDLLRQAVIDDECNQEVVELLFQRAAFDEVYDAASQRWVRQSSLDNLDPALWSWIERAGKEGNRKGVWLKALLRNGSQSATRS